jgi:hypothetical protein
MSIHLLEWLNVDIVVQWYLQKLRKSFICEIKKLTDLLLEDIITNEEFQTKKLSMTESIERLKDQRDKIDTRWDEILKLTSSIWFLYKN